MVLNAFPRLIGVLVNLRELSVNDAQAIAHLMNYNISKYPYEVPDPYSIHFDLSYNDLLSVNGVPYDIIWLL